jgi:hypothetical protein
VVSTNAQLSMVLMMFWVVLITITGLVASNITLSLSEGDVRTAIEDISNEGGGFFSTIFVWIATTILNTVGFENVAVVALGFGSLPEWLNFILFTPLVAFTIYAIVVSFLPTGG